MPYKSRAQQHYFHWLESKGKLPKKTVDEWDDASEGMHLPERMKARKMSSGGLVDKDDREYNRFHDSSSDPEHGDHRYVQDSPYFDEEQGDEEASYPHYSKGGMVEDMDDDEDMDDMDSDDMDSDSDMDLDMLPGEGIPKNRARKHEPHEKVSALFASALARKMRMR